MKRLLKCPECGGEEFEQRGSRRVYLFGAVVVTDEAPGEPKFEDGGWGNGDVEWDEPPWVYCRGCDAELTADHFEIGEVVPTPATTAQ